MEKILKTIELELVEDIKGCAKCIFNIETDCVIDDIIVNTGKLSCNGGYWKVKPNADSHFTNNENEIIEERN